MSNASGENVGLTVQRERERERERDIDGSLTERPATGSLWPDTIRPFSYPRSPPPFLPFKSFSFLQREAIAIHPFLHAMMIYAQKYYTATTTTADGAPCSIAAAAAV